MSRRISLVCQLSFMSHNRTVLSQDTLANTDCVGLKLRLLTGPSWPLSTCHTDNKHTHTHTQNSLLLHLTCPPCKLLYMLPFYINISLSANRQPQAIIHYYTAHKRGLGWPPEVVQSAWTTGRFQTSPELQHTQVPHLRPPLVRRTASAVEKLEFWSYGT